MITSRAIVMIVVAATAVQAQASQDTVTLAPVTVTATRLPVERQGAPASITVLSGGELRARGITRLADALRDVPGASIVQSGSFGSQTAVFMRGGESDYTKVLIDGVPVNDAGGAVDLAHISVADVDRIEIVRGPASVLWGSDAVTGVIQIFTHRTSDRTRVDLSARGGTYGARDASGAVSVTSGSSSFSGSIASQQTDGVLDFNNGYRNRHVGAAVRTEPTPGTALRAMIRHSDATYHYPTDFLGVPVDSNQYRREKRLVASVEGSAAVSSRVTARLLLAANELDAINDNQVDRPDDFAYHDESEGTRRVVDGRVDIVLPRSATFTTGAEWTRQREANTAGFDGSRLNRAYYAQLLAGGSFPWLVVGARVDDNEKFGTFVTTRASGSWRLTSATRARVTFGTAFKEPAFAEIFSTSFTRGNPGLRPERSRSIEGSVEQTALAERVKVGVTWFDQRFRDRVDFIPFPPDSAVFGTFANIGRARASGVEVEARVAAYTGLAFTASYGYLDTEITDDEFGREGQRLLRRPRHTASATAAYSRTRGSLSLTANRIGSRHDVGYVRLPWYTTVDVAGEVRVFERGPSGVSITGRLENAFDERYEAIAGFSAPGRALLLGGRVTLGW
ncbi:MAG TPA: TonB-dependent receptor [Gemmatimonadaceae bacterium]|nr:TonB-dependent receptor [Gemmatimonadaceae bacterium]